jgi:PAS domain S-box-containing protein
MDKMKNSNAGSETRLLEIQINARTVGISLFWISILTIMVMGVIVILYVRRGLYLEAGVMFTGILLLFIGMEFNRRNNIHWSGSIIAMVLLVMVTILATIGEGIHDIGIMAYPSILIIASLILRRNAIVNLGLLTILAIGRLVFGERMELYKPNLPVGSTVEEFLVITCILIVTSAAVYLLSNTVQNSLIASSAELEERVRTERILRETETLYRELVEQTSVITYRDAPDETGTGIHISPQIEDLIGYSQADWLSSPDFWKSLVHPDDLQNVLSAIHDCLKDGKRNVSEYRLRTRDDRWVWVRDQSIVVKDENGTPLYVHGAFFDITERKNADESLCHYAVQVQNHVKRLSMLNKIGYAVSTLQDLSGVLELTLEQVQRNIPLDIFYVCLYDDETEDVAFPLYFENGQHWQEPSIKLTVGHRIEKTLREGQIIRVNRTREEVERARQTEYHLGDQTRIAACALFVPMRIGKRIIGAISVQSYAADAFGEEHLSLLEGIAPQVSIAIENARLFQETRQRAQRLSTLHEIGQAISTLRDLPNLYETVYQQAKKSLPMDLFFIGLYDRLKNEISFPIMYNEEHRWEQSPSPVNDNTFSGKTILSGKPIMVNHWAETIDADGPKPISFDGDATKITDTLMFAPLISGEDVIGIISVQSHKSNAYSEDDLALLTGIANQVAIAIENSRLYTAVQQELRERQRAEQELQIERDFAVQVMNALGQGVTVSDIDGKLEYVTPASAKILGLSPEALIGREIRSFTHPDDLRALEKASALRKNGAITSYENRVLRSNGEIAHVLITGAPRLVDGQIVGSISVVADMTEIKKNEMERESLIKELERKNAELEQFTYTVSHDLKSPLITIRGYLGYIGRDAEKGDVSRLKQDMERIGNATLKMQELLNDLLELSRIGRVINPPEVVSFEEITREAMSLVEGKLEARKVKVRIGSGLPQVRGDRARLVEVMQNLLDNAASCMGNQPDPWITVGVMDGDGEKVFFVKDNGVGIEPKFHERIFGLFNKLNPDSEGTGVGLALAKRIIQVHNSRIWVESELGQGAQFFFTLGQPKNIMDDKETA